MPTIRVNIDIIDYSLVLEYYNTNKKDDDSILEKLDREEGGFQIKIPEKERECCDSNEKIRQLRWNQKRLVQYNGYKSFQDYEIELLFQVLQHIYGKNAIFLE